MYLALRKRDEASKVKVISWMALVATEGVRLFFKSLTGISEEAGAQNINGPLRSTFEQLSGDFCV